VKFILVLQICSAVYQQCSDPFPQLEPYNTFYDCATAGYLNAITINQELGKQEIIKGKIMVSFKCEQITSS
jgi:hypothetical protein